MNLSTYLELLLRQGSLMTEEMCNAIDKQGELSLIASQKMREKDELYDKWATFFKAGCEKLFSQFPEVRQYIPPADEPTASVILDIAEKMKDDSPETRDILNKMHLIPELNQSQSMNEALGKAYYDFFNALSNLNCQISTDRNTFFTPAYKAKMSQLADEGVFLYFLETPDFPLLYDDCDADYVLESFSFANYLSLTQLFSNVVNDEGAGVPLQRKIEDIVAAIELMKNGFFRSAARNWLALIEHEHKRCAETLEGYWAKREKYINGKQRSEKITALFEKIDKPWEYKVWQKIDTYYGTVLTKSSSDKGTINRNSLIHGDYNSDQIDVSENNVIRLALLWLNMRIITDSFSFEEELVENITTMLPYLCVQYDKTD